MRNTGKHTVIIKGNRFQAARAAADRGLPLVFVQEWEGATIGITRADVDKLNAWLCEHGEAPFVPGTLLSWSNGKDGGQ